MSTQENVQIAKDTFAGIGRGDMQGLLALSAEDIEWIIPGEWPLAGTHRGHGGVADLFQKASEMVEFSFLEPREFVAQGDRVLVGGISRGRVKATNRTFEDLWVFAFTVRNGKVTNIREYIDTLAVARAFEMAASPKALPVKTDTTDQRPPVAVGHVRLNVSDVGAAARWLETAGLRPIVTRGDLAVLELRGGTHVVVLQAETPAPGTSAPFDLMVDDVDATHRHYAAKGLSPSPISRGRIHDSFTVAGSGGWMFTINSTHASGQPI
jgi:uncharacterized protein